MINIYYSKITHQLDASTLNALIKQLPPAMQKQVLKYRKWQDVQRGLFGKLLLKSALENAGFSSTLLNDVRYNDYNRPFFNNSLDFNISHSGNYVICVISKTLRVGIDVEEIQDVSIMDFNEQFSQKELASITSSLDPLRYFFTLWTQKEAFLKAIGIGLNIPLNTLDLSKDEVLWQHEKWFLREVKLDENYICYVCTNSIFQQMTVKELKFD